MFISNPPELEKADTTQKHSLNVQDRLLSLFQIILILSVPLLLVLLGSRLAMTSAFLYFEYNRPGFPDDAYGFTREDRLEYAPYALDYLVYNKNITYLSDLTFPDGAPLFNERELAHMEDVQTVTWIAFNSLAFGGLFFVVSIIGLWQVNPGIATNILGWGSLLTFAGIGVIVIVAIAAWDFFFTAFHQMFFESGTWRFYYSDTLIRLFPEQFWFDAAIFIGAFASAVAVAIGIIASRQRRKNQGLYVS